MTGLPSGGMIVPGFRRSPWSSRAGADTAATGTAPGTTICCGAADSAEAAFFAVAAVTVAAMAVDTAASSTVAGVSTSTMTGSTSTRTGSASTATRTGSTFTSTGSTATGTAAASCANRASTSVLNPSLCLISWTVSTTRRNEAGPEAAVSRASNSSRTFTTMVSRSAIRSIAETTTVGFAASH
ncbi:hypothetical protein GCM10027280_18410 [Micromonospora polyrhachis]